MLGTVEAVQLLGLLAAIILVEVAAQYCCQRSHQNSDRRFLACGFLLYGCVAVLLFLSYRYVQMGKVNIYWNAGSTLAILMLGMLVFHERINGWDVLGIVLTFLGLYLIFAKGHDTTAATATE